MSSLGFNTGYIDEIYKQYREDPESVSESWRDFFEDYHPDESSVVTEVAETTEATEEEAQPAGDGAPAQKKKQRGEHQTRGDGEPPPQQKQQPATAPPPQENGAVRALQPASASPSSAKNETTDPIRGASAKVVDNMEESLGIPTATSVRTIAVKLMIENRALLNDYQRQVGGEKVSFTHLIAHAMVKGLQKFGDMNSTFRYDDEGEPQHVVPGQINLGLAVDVERRGERQLMVPNVKDVGSMNFAQFVGAYNDVVQRTLSGDIELSDFDGTTATLTNPGMIGTSMSVARLMPGQGVIVGAGAIGFPPEYRAFSPKEASKAGVSQVMTLTSTYDHRVIQGATSGAFLNYIEELLLGKHGFYQDVFSDLGVPHQPYSLEPDNTPRLAQSGTASSDNEMDDVRKQAAVLQLINAYRVRGHLQADMNPLGYEWTDHPELDPATYGLTVWDLDRTFVTGGLGGKDELPLREILATLRDTYTARAGIEYMHLSDPQEKRWLQERIEPEQGAAEVTSKARRRILKKLNAAESLEHFIHTKYIGHKRFSLEGAESLIPMLDTILSDAADQEVSEVVMGMAHRGRLNVLANIFDKPYENIFTEFEGNIDPNTTQGSGDVKYHLGQEGTHEAPSGAEIDITLASNPSHLESVNPVVEGMVRAKQSRLRAESEGVPGGDHLDSVLPLLIHGDAAFAGQGVAAETLALSQLRGYKTGGTVHVVVNNQIGFTTLPADARSSTYATDLARTIQSPIFHVNGDDPEACLRIARLALDYRQVFNKDVVIDMLCYRVHGHNEGDEPRYTQPLLYEKIEEKRSPRKLYTESLMRRGDMEPEEAEKMLDDYRERLEDAFERTEDIEEREPPEEVTERMKQSPTEDPLLPDVDTTARRADLKTVVKALTDLPDDFHAHKKLKRQFDKRDDLFEKGRIDWAFAETLAFGSLLLEDTPVRISGQDTRRATFSQRHAVLVDQETGAGHIPLNNMRSGDNQADLRIYDSPLSEYAVCGFEYGYSVADPSVLTLWEAQFGDFANGAQIVFDQFLSASEEKWGQKSGLVLLLPHAYEGQGPEHSSARLERFLQLCAENNMTVANFSTPANYFHALRRQVKRDVRKPLVIMTPKSLLRHPQCVSAPGELTGGGVRRFIPAENEGSAERLILTSGKVYYDLKKALDDDDEPGDPEQVAIARVEQYYPFPAEAVRAELERFKNAEVVWAQEEPRNMGAWTFLQLRLDAMLEEIHGDCEHQVRYAGRPASASPAVGSAKIHKRDQAELVRQALVG